MSAFLLFFSKNSNLNFVKWVNITTFVSLTFQGKSTMCVSSLKGKVLYKKAADNLAVLNFCINTHTHTHTHTHTQFSLHY